MPASREAGGGNGSSGGRDLDVTQHVAVQADRAVEGISSHHPSQIGAGFPRFGFVGLTNVFSHNGHLKDWYHTFRSVIRPEEVINRRFRGYRSIRVISVRR